MAAVRVMLYYYAQLRRRLSTALGHAHAPPPPLARPFRRRQFDRLRDPLRAAAAGDRGAAVAGPGDLAQRPPGTGLRGVRHAARGVQPGLELPSPPRAARTGPAGA